MKKALLALAVITTIGLAGFQSAEARSSGGNHGHMMGSGQGRQLDEETAKVHEKFMAETTELRRQMHAKKTELRAVLANEKPDEKKAARLSEELFDLRENMRAKAKESGLSSRGMGGYFCDGPHAGGRGMGRGRSDSSPQGHNHS